VFGAAVINFCWIVINDIVVEAKEKAVEAPMDYPTHSLFNLLTAFSAQFASHVEL
jgi:hypothetical protein